MDMAEEKVDIMGAVTSHEAGKTTTTTKTVKKAKKASSKKTK